MEQKEGDVKRGNVAVTEEVKKVEVVFARLTP
jgi:hypothetical protein